MTNFRVEMAAMYQQWWEILLTALAVALLLVAFGCKIGIFKCVKSPKFLAFFGAEQRCGIVGPQNADVVKNDAAIWHSGAGGECGQGRRRLIRSPCCRFVGLLVRWFFGLQGSSVCRV